ncbi:hypothetical protein TSOC_002153 [Tetrabaena socialis]|uniref:N-acetyltransferase domain-containing protein n=1 Tax=Tetrabaena socialis TaxID=47790 RepID=A0A2J8AEY3_9CHLO|nr:hypothetical protein TSOC_002153 [Tetrabaena socialis]|eukprot:PNH11056.1 hypothetical protein TSOC_002153 [Tetrabaena socialis]
MRAHQATTRRLRCAGSSSNSHRCSRPATSTAPAPPRRAPLAAGALAATQQLTAAGPSGTALRVRLARTPEEFDAVARLWAEALLLPGWTELAPPEGEAAALLMAADASRRLREAYERKVQAAADSRELRRRGEALLSQLRSGRMTLLEVQLARRQLEGVSAAAHQEGSVPAPTPSLPQRPAEASTSEPGAQRPEVVAAAEPAACGAAPALATMPSLPAATPDPAGPTARPQDQPRAGCSGPDSSLGNDPPHTQQHHHHHHHHHQQQRQRPNAEQADAAAEWAAQPALVAPATPAQAQAPAGYLLLSLSQPLALLPPPFPSRAPQQVHVDALAVAAGGRRRGVASALLAAAERVARRWGGSSLWLHADAANEAAVQLYSDRGYRIARVVLGGGGGGGGGGGRGGGAWWTPRGLGWGQLGRGRRGRRFVMHKQLATRSSQAAASREGGGAAAEAAGAPLVQQQQHHQQQSGQQGQPTRLEPSGGRMAGGDTREMRVAGGGAGGGQGPQKGYGRGSYWSAVAAAAKRGHVGLMDWLLQRCGSCCPAVARRVVSTVDGRGAAGGAAEGSTDAETPRRGGPPRRVGAYDWALGAGGLRQGAEAAEVDK